MFDDDLECSAALCALSSGVFPIGDFSLSNHLLIVPCLQGRFPHGSVSTQLMFPLWEPRPDSLSAQFKIFSGRGDVKLLRKMLQLGATCNPLTWRATVIPCNLTALKQTYRITSSQTASHNVIPDHIAEDHTSNKMALLLPVMIIPILIETFGTLQFSSWTVTNNLQSPSIVIWVHSLSLVFVWSGAHVPLQVASKIGRECSNESPSTFLWYRVTESFQLP